MNNISTTDNLWPVKGEKMKYFFNDTDNFFPFEPRLVCGNEYPVQNIAFSPLGPILEVFDENERPQWVFMYKFRFLDEEQVYGKEDN